MGTNIFLATSQRRGSGPHDAVRKPSGPTVAGRICPHCNGSTESLPKANVRAAIAARPRHAARTSPSRSGLSWSARIASSRWWAVAFTMAGASKKGFSAHQLHRQLGCEYNTAWFLHHRVMEAMRQGGLDLPKMGGEGKIVEADETYYGNSKDRRTSEQRGDCPYKHTVPPQHCEQAPDCDAGRAWREGAFLSRPARRQSHRL